GIISRVNMEKFKSHYLHLILKEISSLFSWGFVADNINSNTIRVKYSKMPVAQWFISNFNFYPYSFALYLPVNFVYIFNFNSQIHAFTIKWRLENWLLTRMIWQKKTDF